MKKLLNMSITRAERNGEKHFVMSIVLQDTVIQPPATELDKKQFNMALAVFTPEEHVVDALRYFASELEKGMIEPEKTKLIGL